MATTLTTWRPFSELGELRRRFDHLFEEMESAGRGWSPAVDLIRDEGHLTLKADVPGLTADEVELKVEDGVLTVSGEHSEEHEEKQERYVRRERRRGPRAR